MAMTWTNLIFAFVILAALGALSSRLYHCYKIWKSTPSRVGW